MPPILGSLSAASVRSYGFFNRGLASVSQIVNIFYGTTRWTAPTGVSSIEYLAVAGGGGGSGGAQYVHEGGAGGAGGLLRGTGLDVTPGTTYTFVVGAGGAGGGGGSSTGSQGANS